MSELVNYDRSPDYVSEGFSATVADAVDVVKKSVDYVTKNKGGHGAVRELCEMILQTQGKWPEIAEKYEFADL